MQTTTTKHETSESRRGGNRPDDPQDMQAFLRRFALRGRDPAQGDENLYRYCSDEPIDATDPSGTFTLLGYAETQAEALQVLRGTVARLRGSGWNFAANLLEYFIEGKGSPTTPYTLTKGDVDEVKEQSTNMVGKIISYELHHTGGIASSTLKGSVVGIVNEHVRWNSTASESFGGSVQGEVTGERFQDTNNALFYAYGGADITIDGRVTGVVKKDGCCLCTVKANVTISDTFAFPAGAARQWVKEYYAGYLLQARSNYQPFSHTVRFTKEYQVPYCG
jgi:hypothetical protein